MKLFVCEKASMARALAEVLPGGRTKGENCFRCGDDVVAWAAGHLLELCEPEDYDPAYKRWSKNTLLYVPEVWKLKVKARAKALFACLKKQIDALNPKADTIVNAGDADREGEVLIREILDYCGWNGKTLRLRLNDMNPDAVRKALSNMKDDAEYTGEYRAGQARTRADWLAGLAMTRYVTVSLRDAGYKASVLSVGRVQTPTLGLVVSRDREIREFASSPYFDLRAVLTLGDAQITGRWLPDEKHASMLDGQKRLVNREAAISLTALLNGKEGRIASVTKQARKSPPPLPYSLPKLQMAASKRYDLTDTLAHVQKLYEAGYTSYPRTECEHVPDGHFKDAPKILGAIREGCLVLADMLGGVDPDRKSGAWNDAKISEHHAIIPTGKVPREGLLSDVQRKVYDLICARYALQFFPDFEYEETVVTFDVSGESFRASGRTVVNLGWQGWEKGDEKHASDKNAGNDESDENDRGNGQADQGSQILPAVREGDAGTARVSADEKQTKPPKPYTYHALLAAMNSIHTYVEDPGIRAKLKEVQGIGTAATQEGILSTLFDRGYIEKKKKILQPTELGRLLIGLLNGSKASAMTKPDMTALWEKAMDDIETGDASLDSFVADVAGMVREIVSAPLNVPAEIPGMERRQVGEIIEASCPLNCGGNARRYEGKFGPFWKCDCSAGVTFADSHGVPVVKEPRVEAPCPMMGCKGKAARFSSKKDNRPFWKCGKCGQFFDDIDGVPMAREAKAKLKGGKR